MLGSEGISKVSKPKQESDCTPKDRSNDKNEGVGNLGLSSRRSDDSEMLEIPKKKLKEMAKLIAHLRSGNMQ